MEAYQQLEHEWSKWNDLHPAGMVACSSGTAALHLALEALHLPQGSEVITGDFNMIAVPRAIVMAGLTPVFIDCDETLQMNGRLVRYDLFPNVSATIFVHIYGRVHPKHNMSVVNTKTEMTWKVVEDLAEAHGVRPHSMTDAATWSFYRNKIIAGEEGGAVWFRDPKHAILARQLRSLGFTDAHDFTHIQRGHNYRMSNLHADWIMNSGQNRWGSLPDARDNTIKRREIESWYDIDCPSEYRMPLRQAPWVYDLRIKGMHGWQQNEMVKALQEVGIAARHGFKPMSMQKEFYECRLVCDDRINGPASLIAAREVIYLPIQPGVTTQTDCQRAFEIINKTLE